MRVAVLLALLLLGAAFQVPYGEKADPANSHFYSYYGWPDEPPVDCMFEQSRELTGITFTGRFANYTSADTSYPMWARDGTNYSAWTDGSIEGYFCNSNFLVQRTGQAKIVGSNPLNLGVINLGSLHSGPQYYPSVRLVADGVFYIGSYSAFNDVGYFEGFRYSRDWDHFTEQKSEGWEDPYWIDARDPDRNFFDELGQARFRVPHAVVFGQDNSLSPDGSIYLSAHGISIPGNKNNWDKGDAVYLCRVDSDPKKVIDPLAYEFYAGKD